MPKTSQPDWLDDMLGEPGSKEPIKNDDSDQNNPDPNNPDPNNSDPNNPDPNNPDPDKNKKPDEQGEDEPVFKREPKKQKQPEDSIAELRKSRDELRKSNEAYTQIFGDNPPSVIKPLFELVSERADGPITEETVVNIISELKQSEEQIQSLREELEAKELEVQSLDIRSSSTYKKNYVEPYEHAVQALFLEFANVASDKSIIAPSATGKLHKFLMDNPEISGVDMKAALAQFSSEYEKESGEKPELPSVTNVMKALREFRTTRGAMQDAFVNWKTKKEEDTKRLTAQQQIEEEARQRGNKRMRNSLVSKAFREFDLDASPFIDEKEIEILFKEEYEFGEQIFSGSTVPTYDAVMQKGVKARLWDKYLPRLRELIELESSLDEKKREGLPGSRRPKPTGGKDTPVDWMAGALQ